MLRFDYPVDLSEDEDGRTLAVFPDLPGAATDGATREEALTLAIDCLEEALAIRILERENIPAPSPARGRPTVSPGITIAAKAALYLAMREQGVRKTALADQLGCDESDVRRLLDPARPSKIDRLEKALAALGKRVDVSVRDAA